MIFYGWRIVAAAFLVLFTVLPAFVGRAAAGSIAGFLFMLAGSMTARGAAGGGAVYDAYGACTPRKSFSHITYCHPPVYTSAYLYR